MSNQNLRGSRYEFDSRWIWVRIHGAKIRHIGERLEFCQPMIDDFPTELRELKDATEKVQTFIAEIEANKQTQEDNHEH